MAIKIKHKDPKSTDFGPNDIVINIKEGTIFYKSEKGLFKIQGDQLNTTTDIIKFESDISASKGFFTTPGIGTMKLGVGPERNKFTIGPSPTIEVTGHILPSSTAAPSYDLGSPNKPFRDLFLSPSSIKFIKTRAGIGGSRIGTTFIVGKYKKETVPEEEETFTQENVTDLKAGRSIISERLSVASTGEAERVDGTTNYIRPEVIFHPTDAESAIILKTAGRLQYRSAGGDPFEIFCDNASNDFIRLGSTTTNVTEIRLHGTVSASIDGGSF